MKAKTLIKSIKQNLTQQELISQRKKYLSGSYRSFEAFDKPFTLTKGKGFNVYNEKGEKFIDLVGQNICISVGFGHPKILKAHTDQINKLHHCSTMYHHEEPVLLAKELTETLPAHPSGEDWVVHLVNSGSEAVDLALQMARVYTKRPEVLAFNKAYHGLQGYAAAVTAVGKAIQPCNSSIYNSIKHLEVGNMEQIEDTITYATGGNIGAFIAEPLLGFGGIYPLKKGYLQKAFKIVRENGGVCIADEVQTGLGRCGDAFWGFDLENNKAIPDIITVAKGLGNGVVAIGAVIAKRSIGEAFSKKMFFNTYGGNPTACATARAVLKVMKEEKIVENCQKVGRFLKNELQLLCKELPEIYKEVRGSGLFLGLEIKGKTLKESGKNAQILQEKILSKGVIVGRSSAMGNVFRIQPAMCFTEKAASEVVDKLREIGQEFLKEQKST